MSDAKRDAKRDLKIQTPMSIGTLAYAVMILCPEGAEWCASGSPMSLELWKEALFDLADPENAHNDEFHAFIEAITKLYGSLPPATVLRDVEKRIHGIRRRERDRG